MTKILYGNSEKRFLKCEKMRKKASRAINSHVQINSKSNEKPYDYLH